MRMKGRPEVKVRKLTPEMRREQTRAYLLDAAAAVFAARGFHDASLDEIAEAAGFTKGALYSNFGGKADLFLAVADRREHARFSELLRAAQSQPDAGRRREAMKDAFRLVSPSEAEWALWQEFELYALRKPELRERLARRERAQFAVVVNVLREHLAANRVVPPISAEALGHLFIGVFDRLARARAVDPELVPETLFVTLVDFIAGLVFGAGAESPVPRPVARASRAGGRRARP
jgi:AcrR family transcriptional regulator